MLRSTVPGTIPPPSPPSHESLGYVYLVVIYLLLSKFAIDGKLACDKITMVIWLVATSNLHKSFSEKVRILQQVYSLKSQLSFWFEGKFYKLGSLFLTLNFLLFEIQQTHF